MASSTLICETQPWKDLKSHVEDIKKTHLRELLSDTDRCKSMMVDFDGITLDYSRQRATPGTMDKLYNLAEINSTENRSVLHVALRAPRDAVMQSDGKNVVPDVWNVLDKIKDFSERVRNGSWVGATGKALTDVISVGIGGSFLGPLFVHTALQTDPEASKCATGRQLRFVLQASHPKLTEGGGASFNWPPLSCNTHYGILSEVILANVDPIDVARNIAGLKPETTLVLVVSKTFTTAETMLNARTLRAWISKELGPSAVAKHMVAISTNLTLVEKFGIDPNHAFAFWDWVGGRYSVCSAVGVLPLSLQYGFTVVEKYVFEVLLDLKQLVSMESNGKGVSIDGKPLPFETGEIDFGEPGTNGQHSFYQLIHQGRVVPCDFIGIVKSQQPVYLEGEVVNNHDELMSNFFAQPDALAYGKTPEELLKENVLQHLVPHKTFSGNRPSLSLLLPSLDAYKIGQVCGFCLLMRNFEFDALVSDSTPAVMSCTPPSFKVDHSSSAYAYLNLLLAIYEHRVAVQGFIWGINSFDQWGVELGKSLATQVRKQLHASRVKGESAEGFNFSTTTMLTKYLKESFDVPANPPTILPRI
ncbi:hypothetical protein DKX38_012863 [Salix brachista]|uniref:Glucose-6-phosphate isomerase n=1 Tax=Salix brachista TaxID=2182728 RepID=A0A5N5LRM1_9ROSI|nr:hypothetical protein DKX38_012863 [Salix brachista]